MDDMLNGTLLRSRHILHCIRIVARGRDLALRKVKSTTIEGGIEIMS